MGFQTLVVISVVVSVNLLSACGGGRSTPNIEDPAPINAAAYWGLPGGNAANTRLSDKIGPTTNEFGWSTFSERGITSNSVVAPDGTVVFASQEKVLIGLRPDGSVRWRVQTSTSINELFMSDDGTICYEKDYGEFRLISPDGRVVLDYESEDRSAVLLDFGPEGVMYLRSGSPGDNKLSAVNTQGDVLFEKELLEGIFWLLALPGGGAAFNTYTTDLIVVDANGEELWSKESEDQTYRQLWLNPDGKIYAWFNDRTNQEFVGYYAFSLDGTQQELVEPDFPDDTYRMVAVTPGGGTIWTEWKDDLLVAVDPDGSIIWEHRAEADLYEQVIIGKQGEVYAYWRNYEAGTNMRKLVGFNAAGEIIQTHEFYASRVYTPGIGEQGEVFFGNRDKFYAYSPDGELRWSYDFGGVISSIATGPDGTVYSTGGNVLYATSPAGNELWRYSGPDILRGVIVGSDGKVYTHTFSGIIELTSAGDLVQEVLFDNEDLRYLSVSNDGNVYAAFREGLLIAYLPGLTPAWEFVEDNYISRVAIGEDGSLYFGASGGLLYALDSAGQTLWVFENQDTGLRSPVVTKDGIYGATFEGGLFKLGLDGKLLWRFEPPNYCYLPPSIGPDGTVYLGTSARSPYPSYALPTNPDLGGEGTSPPAETSKDAVQIDNDPVLLDLDGVGVGLYAITPDGTEKWNLHTNHAIEKGVCIDATGRIFLALRGQLFSINPDGTQHWRYNSEFTYNIAPVIGSDGSIIYGAGTNLISIGPGN